MEEVSGWEEVTAVHRIHMSPCYLGSKERLETGVRQYLDSFLGKYDQLLRCIPFAHSRIDWSLAGPTGTVLGDNPQAHFDVRVRWTAFVPTPGLQVIGRVVGLDSTGLTLEILQTANWKDTSGRNQENEVQVQVQTGAAELKEAGWTWSTYPHDEWGEGQWTHAKDHVPRVGEEYKVFVAGPGGPTGILGRLKESFNDNKKPSDSFTITPTTTTNPKHNEPKKSIKK